MPDASATPDTATAAPPAVTHTAPHPVLGDYYAKPEEREEVVSELFDSSAQHYDWINHVLSFGSGNWYRNKALKRAGLSEGMTVVDVACGTGVISERAAKIVSDASLVTSVDPSAGMRAQAKQRRGIDALEGRAESLPLPDDHADFLVMGYALRHVAELSKAFAEYRRVLKPGGRLLLLEITSPNSRVGRSAARFYLKGVIPTVMRVFSRSRDAQRLMEYHWDSIEQCVRPEAIMEALEGEGFTDVKRHVELGLFSEYTATA